MLTYFPNLFSRVNLWNRTKARAENLRVELNKLFPDLSIRVLDESTKCVNNADVIVTATKASAPLFSINDLKKASVHINGNDRGKDSRELLILTTYST